jgi:hypothetical protein
MIWSLKNVENHCELKLRCVKKGLQYNLPGLNELHTDYYMKIIIVYDLNDYY